MKRQIGPKRTFLAQSIDDALAGGNEADHPVASGGIDRHFGRHGRGRVGRSGG